MKKRVMATMVCSVLVLAGCNDKQASMLESVSSEETSVAQADTSDTAESSSDQSSDVSTETQESVSGEEYGVAQSNDVSTETQESEYTQNTNESTVPREYTKTITMKYGNDSEIIFDWSKSDEKNQTLYQSLKDKIDSSAVAIFSRKTTGDQVITCSPAEDSAEKLKYECDDQSTMTLYKNKTNYILLQGEETIRVGVIEILGTENKVKG